MLNNCHEVLIVLSTMSRYLVFLAPLLAVAATVSAEAAGSQLDPQRIAALARMLPAQPVGVGRPITDRAAWEALAKQPQVSKVIDRAEGLLKQPLPDQPDDLFLEFSRTGNRTHWQKVAGERRGRITPLVLAECLENKGRFIPAFEALVKALCAERTWVMPAHDGKLENFYGKTIDIDLASSALAWQLADAYWLLGDKLSPETRQLLRDNIYRRVIDPYRAMVEGQRPRNWWMNTTNNWNAVCLAGVTGAALATVDSREERAEFVAAAEKYSRNFLSGFTKDGYCSEGLGYWNYGFGHFVLLAETIRQATGGGLDLMALPEVKAPAQFGAKIEIIGGVAPAFADCAVNAKPSPLTMYYVNRYFGLGLEKYDQLDTRAALGGLNEAMLFLFPNAASEARPAPDVTTGPGLRTWFDNAGILIARPQRGSSCDMGVALKGGNNAEHHNHNDVGSYVVVVGDRPVLLDPGAEVYTARTFSSHRYDSKLLNSFGHAVPVVAGKLQRTGAEARGKVLKTDFTPDTDTLEFDMTSAYDVPELKSLDRTFVYSRRGPGSLTVTDHVVFTSPQQFGTAILTLGGWQQTGENSLFVYDVDKAVKVDIDSSSPYTIETEQIKAGAQPIRLGFNLKDPVTEATITLHITAVPAPAASQKGNLLRNGDFEMQGWCWDLSRQSLGAISDEQAASGKYSLKITDASSEAGSNVNSAPIKVDGAGKYQLQGQIFVVSGSGIGLYMKYYDQDGRQLNQTDAKGYIAAVGTLGGEAGKWAPFSFHFETPPGTATMQLWIHSFNAAQVEAFIDDIVVCKQ